MALHLAARGIPTLFGDYLVNRYVETTDHPVVYIDGDQSFSLNKHILNNGGVVLNLNPEGLGIVDLPPIVLENYLRISFAVTNICAWGDKQYELLASYLPEDRRELLRVTGYHSFDLASPSFVPYYRNERLVEKYGENLLLLNTSFATANHKMGFDNYVKMLRKMDEWEIYGNQEYLSYLQGQRTYQGKVVEAFIDLARELAVRYPDRTVIVRPHPAENPATYASRLKEFANVEVTNRGTVREWLACAGAVIHHDCTTGLEAFLMGRNVIQYCPLFDKRYTAALLGDVGAMAHSIDDVARQIDADSMDKTMAAAQRERLRPYLASIDHNACARLADLVVETATQKPHWEPEPLGWWGQAKVWRKYMSKRLRAKQPGRNGRKVRYALEKFPRISFAEISRRLDGLRRANVALPEVELVELAMNTFLVRPV